MNDASQSQSASGLMAFWARITPHYVLRYQEWHNCEHVPERVSIPGFLAGRRYRASDGSTNFLMFYETDTPEVFGSDAYLDALNSPTPWTQEALKYFEEPVRNIYRLRGSAGAPGDFVAPYVTTLRFNLTDNASPDMHAGKWLHALAQQDQVQQVRLYEVDEAISGIMTSERKIYHGGPGAQQYLALLELGSPQQGSADPIKDADRSAFDGDPGRQNVFEDHYWLEITHIKK